MCVCVGEVFIHGVLIVAISESLCVGGGGWVIRSTAGFTCSSYSGSVSVRDEWRLIELGKSCSRCNLC